MRISIMTKSGPAPSKPGSRAHGVDFCVCGMERIHLPFMEERKTRYIKCRRFRE